MKFENIKVSNFEGAFRGLRNPMDSWDKSDSVIRNDRTYNNFVIGENDLNLAQRMIKGGSEESKFLRQIMVSLDITAPRYWWSEFDTYKVGIVANSCSTMHKLSAYPFTTDMFEIERRADGEIEELSYWTILIDHLEMLRQKYIRDKNYKWFRILKQELPEGFLQKRTVTLDYANIRSMIHQRKHHRLSNWSVDFIGFCDTLPYAEELLFYEN